MDNLIAARSTMALSLGFHIIFACIGMTMPFLMVISHWKWLRTGEEIYLKLTQTWSKGVAIFFAIGAVSGTALSFELGLLWPGFMKYAGAIIGMPFSWEGTAFFVEAICIGIFLYGWKRINPYIHWFSGLLVGISGVLSGIFVVCANAWMNAPAGFIWNNGNPLNIDPFAAMFNPAWKSQGLHMIIAAFEATAFAVAGLHAILYLKNKEVILHKKAMTIALIVGSIAAIIQPFSGDHSAKSVAQRQPVKLAAMEGLFNTQSGAPLTIGGIPNEKNRTTDFGIRIPKGLSFLAYEDINAEVKGLEEFPEDTWPPVLITHLAFQVMVGCGTLLALMGVLFLLSQILPSWRKKNLLIKKWFLTAVAVCTPLGFISVEAGWIVTEVGRQPWIIYGLLRTADSVTPVPGQVFHFSTFAFIYIILSLVAARLMSRQIKVLHSFGKERAGHILNGEE